MKFLLAISYVVLVTIAIGGFSFRVHGEVALDDDSSNTLILGGRHPTIQYVNVQETLASHRDLQLRYRVQDTDQVTELDDVPQYFSELNDKDVEKELEYRLNFDRWSDRVILEKMYFGLIWGKSGFGDEDGDGEEPTISKLEQADGYDIFDRSDDYCSWTGITCVDQTVTEIKLDNLDLSGTITPDLRYLSDLTSFDIQGNRIDGSIPTVFGQLSNLKVLCLAYNRFIGKIPLELRSLKNLEKLGLASNFLKGALPRGLLKNWPDLTLLDLSNNKLHGSIPESYVTDAPKLNTLLLENNKLTGRLPENPSILQDLQVFGVGNNYITGTIPPLWMSLTNLENFNVGSNQLTGSIPTELLMLTDLSVLVLNHNRLTGTIPRSHDAPLHASGDEEGISIDEGKHSNLNKLAVVLLNGNELSGIWPPELLHGSRETLINIDLGKNNLTGSLPENIGELKQMKRLAAHENNFLGHLPSSMSRLNPGLEINLAGNLLEGTVPKLFCGKGAMSASLVIQQNGCDAILCPAGTFHPSGAATLQGGCRPCPMEEDDGYQNVLGRMDCPGVQFVHGDLNGDGELSDREILRLLWTNTNGANWGAQFQTWADPDFPSCSLYGVVCQDGLIAKIDMTDAAMCSDSNRMQGPIEDCLGLPSELGFLTDLEVITMNRQPFLHGTIPTEFGQLTNLQYLDMSSSPHMGGSIPTELGQLSNMRSLILSGCGFTGSVPDTFFDMSNLEKLYLSLNMITGTVSSDIGKLTNLKKLMWSRTHVRGTIPNELGRLTAIENLEMYGNELTGTIPTSLGSCSDLKRIDLFNNNLTGPLPEALTSLSELQILHLKLNQLTGTLPPTLGALPYLTWFDLSSNRLHGTIPLSFGESQSIKDFRLGDNMIYDPIPPALCSNLNINGGLVRAYGCGGVICPLGTYSDPGHATSLDGCKPCPEGTTTLYLGSSSCSALTEDDILAIFYNVMGRSSWNPIQQQHWRDPKGNVCQWQGIKCDDQGEILSIRFPLLGLDDPDFM